MIIRIRIRIISNKKNTIQYAFQTYTAQYSTVLMKLYIILSMYIIYSTVYIVRVESQIPPPLPFPSPVT